MAFDDFAGQETGGGITDFTITVTNAFFAVDEKYSETVGSDVWFLNWEGTTDVEGHEVMDRDGFHLKWALLPDWLSTDGGLTVKSQSGKDKLGKAVARMMISATAAVEAAGLKDSPDNPFADPSDPKIASSWVGSVWFIEEVVKDFNNGMVARDLLPTKYLGQAVAGVAPAPVAATPAAPAPVAAVAPVAPVADLRAQVVALASSIGDHSAFVTAAMGLSGVAADPALVGEIVAPDGLWADAQKS